MLIFFKLPEALIKFTVSSQVELEAFIITSFTLRLMNDKQPVKPLSLEIQ